MAITVRSVQTRSVTLIEFWPDYGPGPLWTEDGRSVDPRALGLPEILAERLVAWNARYEEDRIPVEGDGDADWLAEGTALLHDVRSQLGPDYEVTVTEPWWGEDPT